MGTGRIAYLGKLGMLKSDNQLDCCERVVTKRTTSSGFSLRVEQCCKEKCFLGLIVVQSIRFAKFLIPNIYLFHKVIDSLLSLFFTETHV